jgi:hypothetical protein
MTAETCAKKTSAVADRRYNKTRQPEGGLLRFNNFSVSADSLRFFA